MIADLESLKVGESPTERLFKAQHVLIYRLDQRVPSDAGAEAEADGA
ncbi:hypothetical protein [Micromonospora sp. NPDC005189]